jgi:hypothetical protein
VKFYLPRITHDDRYLSAKEQDRCIEYGRKSTKYEGENLEAAVERKFDDEWVLNAGIGRVR